MRRRRARDGYGHAAQGGPGTDEHGCREGRDAEQRRRCTVGMARWLGMAWWLGLGRAPLVAGRRSGRSRIGRCGRGAVLLWLRLPVWLRLWLRLRVGLPVRLCRHTLLGRCVPRVLGTTSLLGRRLWRILGRLRRVLSKCRPPRDRWPAAQSLWFRKRRLFSPDGTSALNLSAARLG